MPSQVELDAMTQDLATLRSAWAQASADVNGMTTGWGVRLLGDTSSRDAQNTALAAANLAIGQLGSSLWLETVSGQRSVASWRAVAWATLKDIQFVDQDLGNWGLSGVLAATAEQTGADIKKDATIGALVALPVLLAAGALYLVVVLGVGRR